MLSLPFGSRRVMMDIEQFKRHIRMCQECGNEFVKVTPHQIYCSENCRWKYNSKKRAKSKAEPKQKDLFAA